MNGQELLRRQALGAGSVQQLDHAMHYSARRSAVNVCGQERASALDMPVVSSGRPWA